MNEEFIQPPNHLKIIARIFELLKWKILEILFNSYLLVFDFDEVFK